MRNLKTQLGILMISIQLREIGETWSQIRNWCEPLRAALVALQGRRAGTMSEARALDPKIGRRSDKTDW